MAQKRFFLIKERKYGSADCDKATSYVLEINEGEEVPQPHYVGFSSCAYIGTQDCANCAGVHREVYEVREYDEAFKLMIDVALDQGKLEEILGEKILKELLCSIARKITIKENKK